ncbi:MAG: ATP-binding cassette domain-containing protein [Methylocystaceae bacterium]
MISLQNVSKHYWNVKALDNINADFDPGHIVGLFGPNGAGKSTVLRLMAGLLLPTRGEVTVEGKAARAARNQVAFLPEENHLYRGWTVKKAADFISTFYEDWDQDRYQQQMGFLNLQEDMKIGQVSKGQQAKIRLLLTIARKAPYLLMDEPFSGIDILTREEIVEALIKDYGGGNQTIIISTHEVGEIENLVDQVVFIDRGRFKLIGDADELRQQRGMSIVDIMKEEFRHVQ